MSRAAVPLLALVLFMALLAIPSRVEAKSCGILASCTCSVSTPSTLNFGAYDPFAGSDTTVNGTITVSCTATGLIAVGLPYTVTLDTGLNSGSSYNPRKMKLTTGATLATYNVFKDSAGSQILGNGTSSTTTFTGTCTTALLPLLGNTCSNDHLYYGRAFAGQTTLVPGTYNDTLVWTLTY